MLDWQNKDALSALRQFTDAVNAKNGKPILFWIGAGASRWCGYPGWQQLADIFHLRFRKSENYDKVIALELQQQSLPEFFAYCKELDPQLYNRLLTEQFALLPSKPVYKRFLGVLKQAPHPLRILTTNVDELLERNVDIPTVLQRSDFERTSDLIAEGKPFIAKLHGSISNVQSTVFTKSDYQTLIADKSYQSLLRQVLSYHTVIFFGYGLGDEHLLNALHANDDMKDLFGDGPHFAVLPKQITSLPSSVKQIIYQSDPHKDHRCAIRALESPLFLKGVENDIATNKQSELKSVHFISDLAPPGKWQSSQTFEFGKGSKDGRFIGTIGLGITDAELPNPDSTAMHDLVVGLLCFDKIVIPLRTAYRMLNMLGDLFWTLVELDILHFVHWNSDDNVVFANEPRIKPGSLASMHNSRTQKALDALLINMSPVPGMEAEAQHLFERAVKNTTLLGTPVDDSSTPPEVLIPSIPETVRSILVYSEVRKTLGFSEGTPIPAVPPWLKFSALRLAEVVRVGLTCNALKIPSVKLVFGLSGLAGPVFPACSSGWWIDNVASYALSNNFNCHVGTLFMDDVSLINGILNFRDTQEGVRLRKEVLDQLQTNEASEIGAAVNGGLRTLIPQSVLDAARSKLAGLMIARGKIFAPTLWNNIEYDADAMKRWKARTSQEFLDYCKRHGIGRYDPCPCDSGDQLRFCCEEMQRITTY